MDDIDEGFEDEPMTTVRAEQFSGNRMVIENMDDMERKRQKRKRRRRKRLERLGKLAVCVCCAGILSAIIATIVLTEAAIRASTPPPPTPVPTHMPVVPTFKPTMPHPTAIRPGMNANPPIVPTMAPVAAKPTPSPTMSIKDTYTLNPIYDTYIYTDGPNTNMVYGKDTSMLVQTGFKSNDNIATAIALLVFDTSSVPDYSVLAQSGRKCVLKIYHEPVGISNTNRGPSNITISTLPPTNLNIELVSGKSFTITKSWDGPTVSVAMNAAEVTFDISSLVFNTASSNNQVFVMLQARGQEQAIGDFFYSRESDKKPELLFTGMMP